MADKNKILKVAGVALAAVGALVYSALKAAVSSEDYDDDNAKKYKVIYNGDEEDEEFDSYEQARENMVNILLHVQEKAQKFSICQILAIMMKTIIVTTMRL